MRLLLQLTLLAWLASGCAMIDADYREAVHAGPQEKVFYEDFQKVWRATQLALVNYNIKINNMDTGQLETYRVSNPYLWKPAWEEGRRFSSGYGYILRIQVVKGLSRSESAVKVVVEKLITEKRNYIDNPKELPSDGFEEREILYRIGRELLIESAIEKALNTNNT